MTKVPHFSSRERERGREGERERGREGERERKREREREREGERERERERGGEGRGSTYLCRRSTYYSKYLQVY